MTEPTEAAEAHRLINEAFAGYEETWVRVHQGQDVVHRAATAVAAGDRTTAATLLVAHTEQNDNRDEAVHTLFLGAVRGVSSVLDGDVLRLPCQDGGTHGTLIDVTTHAVNYASLGDSKNLLRVLSGVVEESPDTLFLLATVLVEALAELVSPAGEDGDRDA